MSLNDMVFVCAGTEIMANRETMMNASRYFRVLLSSGFSETNMSRIAINAVEPPALTMLVEYARTGKITVTVDNAQMLIWAANMFGMTTVSNVVCDFLEHQLHPSNAMGILVFAQQHSLPHLAKQADLFTRIHFLEVIKHVEFLEQNPVTISTLIQNPVLTVDDENQVLDALLNWAGQTDQRPNYMLGLIEHIRLRLVTHGNFYRSICFCHLEFKNVFEMLALVRKTEADGDVVARAFFKVYTNTKTPVKLNRLTKPRESAGFPQVILVLPNDNRRTNQISLFNFVENEWTDLNVMPKKRSGAQLGYFNEHLYVVGGKYTLPLKSMQVYSLLHQTWNTGIPMLWTRANFSIAVVVREQEGNGIMLPPLARMYAIGGVSTYLDFGFYRTTEYYDFLISKWFYGGFMNGPRAFHGSGVVGNRIYVVGGLSGELEPPLATVEYCDDFSLRWNSAANMNEGRLGVGVGTIGNKVYAIGGSSNGIDVLSSVEVYCPLENVWRFVAPMTKPRFSPGVVVHNNRLVVIGGDAAAFNTIEWYDPETDRWTMQPSLIPAEMVSASCVIINQNCVQEEEAPASE